MFKKSCSQFSRSPSSFADSRTDCHLPGKSNIQIFSICELFPICSQMRDELGYQQKCWCIPFPWNFTETTRRTEARIDYAADAKAINAITQTPPRVRNKSQPRMFRRQWATGTRLLSRTHTSRGRKFAWLMRRAECKLAMIRCHAECAIGKS